MIKFIRTYSAPLALILGGLLLLWMGALQTVTVEVDGISATVETRALTIRGALRDAGISLQPEDQVIPGRGLLTGSQVSVTRAAKITLLADGKTTQITTSERIPANILLEADVRLYPSDRLYADGAPITADSPLPLASQHTLVVRRAQPILLSIDDAAPQTIYSGAATLSQALWEAGIHLSPADRLDPPGDSPLQGLTNASLQRAHLLTVTQGSQTMEIHSAASTVGEALADAGVPLQGLDRSEPAESEPLPTDGQIRVVRVTEDVQLAQTLIPFKSDYQPDPETELDQRSVLVPGVYGLEVSRTRILYEDGVEVSKKTDAKWKVQDPQNRLVGYGTKVVTHSLDTEYGKLEYWRAVQVYATAYSPCRSGSDRCYTGTASGLPVQKGVAAVTRAWYRDMVGQTIYVPGYGKAVIADVGGGIPGQYWIDLGYSDDNYQSWNRWVTIYFLTPIPAAIPYILY